MEQTQAKNNKNRRKLNFKILYRNNSYIFSFLLLIIIAIVVNPNFLRFSNLATQLNNATITGIIAIGMTLVIISGMIDLSVGSIVAFVSGLSVVVLNFTESSIITLLFCLLFGLILGMFNGVLVSKGKIAPFIATLATMSAYRSIIVQIGQGGPFLVKPELIDGFRVFASGRLFGVIPYMPLIFIAVAIIISLFLKKTKFGRYVYAVGSNAQASRLAGINVEFVKFFVFAIVGLLSGLSSFLLSSRLLSITAANSGLSYELDAIAGVAIGGTSMSGGRGKIIGSFLGAVMLVMIQGILIAAKIPPFLTGLVKGVIIIIAVLLQREKTNN